MNVCRPMLRPRFIANRRRMSERVPTAAPRFFQTNTAPVRPRLRKSTTCAKRSCSAPRRRSLRASERTVQTCDAQKATKSSCGGRGEGRGRELVWWKAVWVSGQ